MSDKGIHPGLVERAFRRSNWNSYTERTSKQQARAGYVEREMKAKTKKAELEALEAVQAARPAKPPGKR